jgi:hypothetical protein
MNNLEKYPRVFEKVKSQLFHSPGLLEAPPEAIPFTPNEFTVLAPSSHVLHTALDNLVKCNQTDERVEHLDVLSNIYAAAFVIAWFRPVSLQLLVAKSLLIFPQSDAMGLGKELLDDITL